MLRRLRRYARRAYNAVSNRLLEFQDGIIDRRVCGRSLVGIVPSYFHDEEKGVGGTCSYSTHYAFLKYIFSHVSLRAEDALLDVGCGKGRVLAYLLREKCPCRLYGIEYNPEVAQVAAEWTRAYDQVTVLQGDALTLDYDPYTVFTLARPFLAVTFLTFIERVEQTVTHPVHLVYWYDQANIWMLKKRPGWTLECGKRVARIHGLLLAYEPQTFTVWTYDPVKRAGAADDNPAHVVTREDVSKVMEWFEWFKMAQNVG